MLRRLSSSSLRYLAWFTLASISGASIESFGFFSKRGADAALAFAEFHQLFSNTCGILFVAIALAWLLTGFFMVWLGGVRAGLALLFLVLLALFFDHLVVMLDVSLSYTPRSDTDWAVSMRYFFGFALAVATLCTLVLAKVSRRFRSMKLTLRACAIPAVVIMGAALAVWAKNARFAGAHDALFWGSFAALVVAASLVIWWAGRRPWFLAVIVAGLAVFALAPVTQALFHQTPPKAQVEVMPAAPHAVKHVLLITVDTLRQDSLRPYNPAGPDTPHTSQLATESAVFSNAFTTSPWTYPSVASILTGLPPRVHQLMDGRSALPDSVITLAEEMQQAGYRTGACGFNAILLPRSKLNQGFQEYRFFPDAPLKIRNFEVGLAHNLLELFGKHRPNAAPLTDLAIQWHQDNSRQDSFFWIHYFDPHAPYMPPESFQPADEAQRAMGPGFSDVRGARMGSVARTAAERAWIRALYDGETRFVDDQIGRLLESLREMGIYDDTLIVLTSDHGEEFWDHGHFEHGHTLYNELVRVPLLIKLPASRTGTIIDASVSVQAIMPTVLDLCGVTIDPRRGLHQPLSPLLRDTAVSYAEQPVFAGASLFHDAMECVIFDQMKYVLMTPTGQELLFNLRDDPMERNSLAVQDGLNLEKGRQLLKGAQDADARLTEMLGIRSEEDDFLSQEDIRSLQALGYL